MRQLKPNIGSLSHWRLLLLALAFVLIAACGFGWRAAAPGGDRTPTPTPSSAPAQATHYLLHVGIVTTVFWVGEPADADNGNITNQASTWDAHWQTHFGGVDNPDKRNGFLPASFTPHENPFYIALPYSDLGGNSNRKQSAYLCALAGQPSSTPYSWCKNSWVAVQCGNGIAYAQWEDAGPFGEDDSAYVFGSARPSNTQGVDAGLDVSPAVRDYLGLGDVSTCSWSFIDAAGVPDGPWKKIITTDRGDPGN